jgi:hypothetical protein
MEQCSTMFANDLSDEEYLSFIGVLEDENKARTFLTLARSSTTKRCLMWLKKEAKKLVSIFYFHLFGLRQSNLMNNLFYSRNNSVSHLPHFSLSIALLNLLLISLIV